VTLSGFVSSFMDKEAAELAAKRFQGVRAVANDLQIKLPTTRTDPEIAHDIVHGMKHHVLLPTNKMQATVSRRLTVPLQPLAA